MSDRNTGSSIYETGGPEILMVLQKPMSYLYALFPPPFYYGSVALRKGP